MISDWITRMNGRQQEPMSLLPPGYVEDLARTLSQFQSGFSSSISSKDRFLLTVELMNILVKDQMNELK